VIFGVLLNSNFAYKSKIYVLSDIHS
jgi:hypothetical protein